VKHLIYLSPVPWASYMQRPHYFAKWFTSRSEGRVLWVDPYPTRLPGLGDVKRLKLKENTTKQNVPQWLSLLQPISFPIEPLPLSSTLNRFLWKDTLQSIDEFIMNGECLIGIGKPSAMALEVLERHPNVTSLYDAMDDFPSFYQGMSQMMMERRERRIAALVTRITASSTVLERRFGAYRSKLSYVPNACDVESLPPVKSEIGKAEKPVLGYIGTIGHWFDWSLVFSLADANPLVRIRIIGPAYVEPPGRLPDNIELLPACNHESAIKAIEEFSVGLIPFKKTPLTASVDPIKYYEYRALGLPVLSTRFGEMAGREGENGVFLLNGFSDLEETLQKVLAYECQVNGIQKFRYENSWNIRFDAIGLFS